MVGRGINPFRYSSPVPAEELIDRAGEIETLLDLAFSGNNARLTAPRRYGKTSLLRAVLARAERDGFVTVYVDFFGVLSFGDIAERIEAAYGASLRGRIGQWFTAVRQTLKPIARIGGGPVPAQVELGGAGVEEPLVQRLALVRRVHERTGQRVLVAFDEFQDVLEAGDADAVIRSEIQHHGEAASYIFAGSHVGMMRELFGDRRRAFYAQARPVPLPPLPPEELGAWIAERFTGSGKQVGAALGPLLELAEGHPQRAMLLAHLLWAATPIGGTAGEEEWALALEQAEADARDEIRILWGSLSSNERRVLTTIAEGEAGLYARGGPGPRGGSVTGAVKRLESLGEIVEAPAMPSGWRVVDPLLARWVRLGRYQ